MKGIRITTHQGIEARPYLDGMASLRISVFREYPYLYEGSADYEMEYLASYLSSDRSLVVLAWQQGRIVGASTAIPLGEADADFRDPVAEAGIDVDKVYYFGESVLMPEFRGQGIGHRFFDEREALAATLGYPITGFYSVIRPEDHPLKPSGYRPHDTFWGKRGYARQKGIVASFPWQQVGDVHETLHELVFWIKGSA